MNRARHWLAALLVGGLPFVAIAEIDRVIATGAGEVRGARDLDNDGVMVFLGIPYAAPPVGSNRWRPPQPVADFNGRFAADRWGDQCQQAPQMLMLRGGDTGNAAGQILGGGREAPGGTTPVPISEDCLTLNVWSGAEDAGADAPVMVWIHGNELVRGAASDERYNGATLASRGVVVVSFNYRLGAFGFLAHPALTAEAGSSGNYGLMDAIAALNWVKDNIDGFGGDPDNITVFAGSDGATMAAALIGSPAGEDLFHKAILQSGGWMGIDIGKMQTLAEAEAIGQNQLARFGDASLAELRALPAAQLTGVLADPEVIVDGEVIPRDLSAVFAAGEQNAVDVIVGSNRDEGLVLAQRRGLLESDAWKTEMRAQFGTELTEDFLSLYPATSNAVARQSVETALSDKMAWQMRLLAERQVAIGEDAHVYAFTRVPPGTALGTAAATHGVEVPYVFNTMGEYQGWTAGDRSLARIIASYWINFAETGNPNGSHGWDDITLPEWPVYTGSEEFQTMEFGDRIGTNSIWRLARDSAALFDRVYAEVVPAGSP